MYELATNDQGDAALARIEVGDVWGIGRQWATWLNAQGITNALDLKHADPKQVRKHMGVVGERITYELNGVSCLPLELVQPARKGVTVSRAFSTYLTEQEAVKEALSRYVMRAGEKLRRQGLMARHLSVFLRTNPFSKVHPYYGS